MRGSPHCDAGLACALLWAPALLLGTGGQLRGHWPARRLAVPPKKYPPRGHCELLASERVVPVCRNFEINQLAWCKYRICMFSEHTIAKQKNGSSDAGQK